MRGAAPDAPVEPSTASCFSLPVQVTSLVVWASWILTHSSTLSSWDGLPPAEVFARNRLPSLGFQPFILDTVSTRLSFLSLPKLPWMIMAPPGILPLMAPRTAWLTHVVGNSPWGSALVLGFRAGPHLPALVFLFLAEVAWGLFSGGRPLFGLGEEHARQGMRCCKCGGENEPFFL